MNPEYEPDKKDRRERWHGRYAGPLDEDLFTHADYGQQHHICREQVGRVITQPGLEGALVLSYAVGKFTIRLADGTVTEGEWDSWAGGNDPEGVSSDGWTVGDIRPRHTKDEIPF